MLPAALRFHWHPANFTLSYLTWFCCSCPGSLHVTQDPGLSIANLGATLLNPVAGFIATQPALLAQLAQATLVANVSAGLPIPLQPNSLRDAQSMLPASACRPCRLPCFLSSTKATAVL